MGAGLDPRFEIISATRFQEAQFFSRIILLEGVIIYDVFVLTNLTNKLYLQLIQYGNFQKKTAFIKPTYAKARLYAKCRVRVDNNQLQDQVCAL